MVPNQTLSSILSMILFIVFVVAPILVVVQQVVHFGRERNDVMHQIMNAIVYTEESQTIDDIKSGKIYLKLFLKSLPSRKLYNKINLTLKI